MGKESTAFMALWLSISCANAEIATSYSNSKEIAPLQSGAAIYLREEWGNDASRESIRKRLLAKGFRIVDDAEMADAKISLFVADVALPKDGVMPRLAIGETYGNGLPTIPPAMPKATSIAREGKSASVVDLDAGAVAQGARLTESSSGGVLIGAATSLLSSWFHSKDADAKRTPGVVRVVIRIRRNDIGQGFSVVAAADTPETPDSLFDGAFDAVANALVNGIPASVTPVAKQLRQ